MLLPRQNSPNIQQQLARSPLQPHCQRAPKVIGFPVGSAGNGLFGTGERTCGDGIAAIGYLNIGIRNIGSSNG